VLTLAYVCALQIVYVALLLDMGVLAFFLMSHTEAGVLLLGKLLLLAASISVAYLTSLYAFSVGGLVAASLHMRL
jgi:hypothetical protein